MTAGDLDSSLLGRIVRPADYVRVLATPLRLRSPHFAVHHLDGRPLPLKRPLTRAAVAEVAASEAVAGHAPVTASLSTELSTGRTLVQDALVDDCQRTAPDAAVETTTPASGPLRWLGLVVPKRHAKRAVTRTLVKRQIRHVVADCAPQLEAGLWVVRQRAPFDPTRYPSAASDALKEAARAELRALFERAARGERDRVKPRSPSAEPAKGRSGKLASAAAPPAPDPSEGPPCAA